MIKRAAYRFRVLSLICVTSLTIPSAMADVEIYNVDHLRRLNGFWCDIRLEGNITTADAAVLDAAECALVMMFIHDSPGGDVNAALDIGRWVREREGRISVTSDAYCHSSCALVYIGGVSRSNFGEIGLHRPYLAGAPRSDAEVEELVSVMLYQIREYVDEMGVSPEFASVMINTPPSTMRTYRTDEIYELVAQRDPMYDELQVAQNARDYGIATDEYRRRHAEARQSCVATRLGFSRFQVPGSEEFSASSSAVYECKQAIYWGLSRSVYRNRYNDAIERCNAGDPTPDEVQECGIQVMQGLR